MSWTISIWYLQYSESLISNDKSYIYSLSIYTNPAYLLYFNIFATSDGDVIGSRYVSSSYWTDVIGSTQTGSKIVSILTWSFYTLMIFDTSKNTFSFRGLNTLFYSIETEPLTGK